MDACWVCGSSELAVVKPSNLPADPTPDDFRITDSRYGVTLEIQRCAQCGFLECPENLDLVRLYSALEDPDYEEGRDQRALQQCKLLEVVQPFQAGGRLLDIGAGTGTLVEQAVRMGYVAEGIEPSLWLQRRAAERGLRVHQGVFPHPNAKGPYDVVTLVDVIEHVRNPSGLLRNVREVLNPGGIMLLVMPDVSSLPARLMRWRWWHFRIAHVGYFNPQTMRMLVERSGFTLLSVGRPGWYLPLDYLLDRVNAYLPLRLPVPPFAAHWTVPLNLRDSMYAVCQLSWGPS
jgi:SAM-dependent methyltransferase